MFASRFRSGDLTILRTGYMLASFLVYGARSECHMNSDSSSDRAFLMHGPSNRMFVQV